MDLNKKVPQEKKFITNVSIEIVIELKYVERK